MPPHPFVLPVLVPWHMRDPVATGHCADGHVGQVAVHVNVDEPSCVRPRDLAEKLVVIHHCLYRPATILQRHADGGEVAVQARSRQAVPKIDVDGQECHSIFPCSASAALRCSSPTAHSCASASALAMAINSSCSSTTANSLSVPCHPPPRLVAPERGHAARATACRSVRSRDTTPAAVRR